MNEKSIRVLEYNKITDMLISQAVSEPGRAMTSKIMPLTDIRDIRERLNETTEAVNIMLVKGNPPLGAFYDIRGILGRARKGGTLTMRQLLMAAYNMGSAGAMASYLAGDRDDYPALCAIGEVIAVHRSLQSEIERCIISEDEMADNASSELRSIRRSITRHSEAIKAKMNHMAGSADYRTILQDSIVTMRDGRYVIPVKAEHRSRVPGIIHDQSSSGATLFIEPQVIVNMNNELRQFMLDEKKEIERILQELTDRVAEHYHELKNNQRLLTILDSIFARGKLSMMMGAEEPQIDESGVLVLREARHPLLDREKAVPISVSMGEKHTTIIITGPNTGGKTVTLKTAGLLSMMAQSGLHIPASSESRIPVFREVFADIGDEQSIEQSLSTFSSHMKNIVEIVENAGEGCLVLLDELGAGTDPAEGAALAIAVIERLKSRKALVFATTHYTELKKYAISKEGVENASMEFNVDTLSPTYRLMTGIPGKSNAFEISAKLGLASSVIDQAKELLETGDIEFEDVVSALEDDRRKAEDERNTAMMLVVSAKRQKEELDRKEEELRRKKEEILSKAREEARLIVREAKDVTREIQKELKNLSKIESIEERNRVYSESRSKVKGLEDKHRVRVIKQANSRPVDASKLKVGDRVKVLSFDQNGEVLSLPDGKGILSVQMGAIKVQVSTEDLMLIDVKPLRKQKKEKSYGNMYRQKTMSMSTSINVVGKNLDDAVMDVDKYLDDAFMAGLNQVTVIHGRGEGILRDGLQKMMRHHKHVKSFHRGSYNEGGDGVTVVEIK